MDDPAVANALFGLSWMPTVRNVAAFLVAVGVVIQFAESWISDPWRKIVDDARTKEVAQLSTDLETARSKTAEADARAKEAELQILKLKAGRFITPNGQQQMIRDLASCKTLRVLVGASPVSYDSINLSRMLVVALKNAGLNDAAFDQTGIGVAQLVGLAKGIAIKYVIGNDKGKQCAEVLAKALQDDGLMAHAEPGLDENKVAAAAQQGESRNDAKWEWIAVAIGDRI
jgi:hypothetical protein